MPKNAPYILVNCEAMPPLHFHAHSFSHAFSYTLIVLYHRYTPVNSCYTSSTLTLVMSLYTFVTLPAILCLSHFKIVPCQ